MAAVVLGSVIAPITVVVVAVSFSDKGWALAYWHLCCPCGPASTLRLFCSGVKANMTAIKQDEYVKVYADAPAADGLARVKKLGGLTCYEPASLCLAVQKKYRELYGDCGTNCQQHSFPRVCVQSSKRATGLNAYQRGRLQQQSLIKADPFQNKGRTENLRVLQKIRDPTLVNQKGPPSNYSEPPKPARRPKGVSAA